MINPGDIVSNNLGRTGAVRAVDRETDNFVIYWFGVGIGGGWHGSDLTLVRTAADEAARRARSDARKHADAERGLIARVRAAAGLPDWHSDEVLEEIARVNGCANVAAHRVISREGAKTPLGAKQKVAIFAIVRQFRQI